MQVKKISKGYVVQRYVNVRAQRKFNLPKTSEKYTSHLL